MAEFAIKVFNVLVEMVQLALGDIDLNASDSVYNLDKRGKVDLNVPIYVNAIVILKRLLQ